MVADAREIRLNRWQRRAISSPRNQLMSYQVNFGGLTVARSTPAPVKTRTFRLAVLGDFAARAHRGEGETGEELGARKGLHVDCDNLDEVMARLDIRLQVPSAGGEIAVASMDDLHPDQLYALPVFGALSGLLGRLRNQSTFARAAAEMQTWPGLELPAAEPTPRTSRGTAVPVSGKLSDFAALLDAPVEDRAPAESPLAELLRRAVAPHVVPAKDLRQDALVAAVTAALAAAMRGVLHHPDFQALEALWRSVDLLVRRLELDEKLQVVLYDVTAEELAADLARADALEDTGLYKMLVEAPAQDAHQGPFSVILGQYVFDRTPPHAELLGRVAKIAAAAGAPFVGAVSPSVLETKRREHPLIEDAWSALRALPEAESLALTVPGFLLRLPYGQRTEPVDCFEFEEFTPQTGLRGMLWGNSATLAGVLLGTAFTHGGVKMNPNGTLGLNEMPYYFFKDPAGDVTALPCTERLITERTMTAVSAQGFLPVLAIRGAPEVRLAGFRSVAGVPLKGWWPAPPGFVPPPPEPEPEPEPVVEAEAALEETPAEAGGGDGDAELDTLLASLAETPADPPAEAAMDPELEALLKSLG